MRLRKISRKKQTIWRYFFQNLDFVIGIGNGIILVPIYLIFIDSDIYGAWLATGSIISWLSISDPGIGLIVQQRISHYYAKNDRNSIEKVLSSGLILVALSIIITLILGYILEANLGEIINNEKNQVIGS